MTTIDQFVAARRDQTNGKLGELALRQVAELKNVERQVKELDPLGSVKVIGTHDCFRSSDEPLSVLSFVVEHGLPVIEVSLPKRGVRLFGRENLLHGWAITVESELPVRDLDVEGMDFSRLSVDWFDGFAEAKALIHGSYERDQRHFSFHFLKLYGLKIALERITACL